MSTHFDVFLRGSGLYDPSVSIYADSFDIRPGELGDFVWFENDSGFAACFPLAYIDSIFRFDPDCAPALCYRSSDF